MKYRRLTIDELKELEQEFVRFLASNTVTSEDWQAVKTTNPERADQLIDIFSDIVFDKVIDKILDQFPKYHLFLQQFSTKIVNWLPFYWRGFKQTTRYTYHLNFEEGIEAIWDNFKGNVRRNVRKAETLYTVEEIEEIESFIGPLESSYHKRGKKVPFNKSVLFNIDKEAKQRNQRKIYVATVT